MESQADDEVAAVRQGPELRGYMELASAKGRGGDPMLPMLFRSLGVEHDSLRQELLGSTTFDEA